MGPLTTANWMGRVPEKIKMNELSIIGSHDTAAFKIDHNIAVEGRFSRLNAWCRIPIIGSILKRFVHPLTLTQTASIREQLDQGIRFLDLRVAYDKKSGRFFLAHSFACMYLDEALNDIRYFMEANPSEVVIVTMKPDFENENTLNNQLPRLFNFIKDSLSVHLWKSDGTERVGHKTVKEMDGKVVFCCTFDDNNQALINWRTSGHDGDNNVLHSAKDVDKLAGQLDTNWENSENPQEVYQKSKDKNSLDYKSFGKIRQLDGAPTPTSTWYIIRIIFSTIVTGIANLFRNKENKLLPIGIAYNAALIATAVQQDKMMASVSGTAALTVDMPSAALLQDTISINIAKKNEVEQVDFLQKQKMVDSSTCHFWQQAVKQQAGKLTKAAFPPSQIYSTITNSPHNLDQQIQKELEQDSVSGTLNQNYSG